MARMFPKIFPEDSSSSGERKVFEYLKNKAPADWSILHSFRLPKHKTVIFGEADFVIVAPKLGVFILEIKSGGVGFDGSNWQFINRERKVTLKQRGPFQQACEAMFAIEKILVEKLGDGYKRTQMIYGYGVIFTDEDSFPTSAITEDESWRLYQKCDIPDYCSFIRRLNRNFVEELKQLGKSVPMELSEKNAEKIVNALRPIVDCVTPLKSFVQASESDIIALTTEQYSCLDDIELNDRMVVTGGAGTGKTLIAVEQAKRCSHDEKVAVFCYNKNLAKYIRNNLSSKNVTVYSLHAYLTKICGERVNNIEKNKIYFDTILPGVAALVAKKQGISFDRIIVDEFQDLCDKEYLEFFDAILKNGLMDGKFTFYGDFARQAIYQEASLDELNNFAYFAQKRLSVNCRNTKNIGNELIHITGYEDKRYRLNITGEPVDYGIWNTQDEQKEKLVECLKELKKRGFKAASITILSPNRREKSIVDIYDKERYVIGDYGDDSDLYIATFSTVHSFKGLESEIVILVDVEDYSDPKLMYIALSRARSKLIVLESASASKQRKRLMITR
mgnify:CR=1 FL=1